MAAKKIRPAAASPARPSLARRLAGPAAGGAIVLAGLVVFMGHPPTGLPPAPALADRSGLLREAVQAADTKARAWFGSLDQVGELGCLYQANGLASEAAACWELLARKQPRDGRWPYYLADLARTAGDHEGMVAQLRETLRRDPAYAPGWLRLADDAFKSARYDEAESAYRRRLELVAGDPYARLGLARIALQRGRTDEGKRALAELVREAPDFPSAQNLYAELLARDGDEAGARRHRALGGSAKRFREAEDPWLLALRPFCFNSYQLAVWGSQEEQTGHPDRARALFERAMTVAPADPLPYAELGQLLLDTGEREKAREVLARGLQAAPFNEKAALRHSAALRELGRAQEAADQDQQGLARAPGSVEFLDSLGQSQIALGRFAEAEQSFRAALQRSPNTVGVQVNLGILYLKTSRRAEARRILEAAFAANPEYPKLQAVLGRLALEDNRLEDAARVIEPYFAQHPDGSQARSLFAQLHLLRAAAALDAHDLAAAERWCTAGLAGVPDAAELHGLLGTVQVQNGNFPKALEAMEACLRLQPGDPRAVLPLAMLYVQLKRPADARRVLTEARDWLKSHNAAGPVKQIEGMLRQLPAG